MWKNYLAQAPQVDMILPNILPIVIFFLTKDTRFLLINIVVNYYFI